MLPPKTTMEAPDRPGQLGQEHALLDVAQRLRRHREGRIAVHVHLSRLQSHNRREQHIRVALGIFDDLVKHFEGAIFQLMNQDLVLVCRGARIEQIDEAVLRLRYLFSEDQLTRFADDHTDGGFCTWYILESDYNRFLAMAQRFHDLAEAHRQETQRLKEATNRDLRRGGDPLTPALLGKLEDALATADLSPMIRNQTVCAITSRDPPEPVLREIYVSIDDLERTLLPEVSIRGDPWLFQHLTQVLDKRMLAQIWRDNLGADAFSLNLNIATVLSPEFQRFDQGMGLGMRGRVVIEIQKVDIFHDMGAFIFARDYLRERGFKLCVDGLTHMTLPYIDRARLGIDLLKMHWSPEMRAGGRPELIADLHDQVRAIGKARIIMTRCDGEEAIRIGQGLGISLFQGRHVDRLLAQHRPPAQTMGSARYR